MPLGLFEQPGLPLQHAQRIDVSRHRPRHPQVGPWWDQVSCQRTRQLTRTQDEHLAPRRMPSDMPKMHAWQHLCIAGQKLNDVVAVRQRREVLPHKSRRAPLVGVQREVPLALLDVECRGIECELQAAPLIPPREAARVVPMQMRGDDRVDLLGPDPTRLNECSRPSGSRSATCSAPSRLRSFVPMPVSQTMTRPFTRAMRPTHARWHRSASCCRR